MRCGTPVFKWTRHSRVVTTEAPRRGKPQEPVCPAREDILFLMISSQTCGGIVSRFFTSPAPADGLQE